MDEQLKRRLIGAIVLISLAIIFLPMLLEHEPTRVRPRPMTPIPQEPERKFDSSLLQDRPPAAQRETGIQTPAAGVSPAPRQETPPAQSVAPAPKPSVERKAPSTTTATKSEPKAKPRPKPKPKPKPEPKPKPVASGTPSGWVIQVASLTSRESAEKLVKKLRRAGLDTMDPRPVTVNGKRFYRVQVGPEISRRNAERHLSLIKRVAGTKGQVMRYP